MKSLNTAGILRPTTVGTIAGAGQTVILPTGGYPSGIITVEGTFSGTLTVTGAIVLGGVEGGRLLFRSVVGSTGTNRSQGGAPAAKEFRYIDGGEFVIVRATSWTSGTATVTIHASPGQSTVFINGPVHTAEEEAVRDGRAFLSSTGPRAVLSGNILHIILANPASSTVNLFVGKRLFSNNQGPTATPLEYQAYANPAAVLNTVLPAVNRRVGGLTSQAVTTFQIAPTGSITMGGALGSGEIIPNGDIRERGLEIVIPPANGVGFTLSGAGNNLTQAARLAVTFEWYEEIIS